MKESPAHTCSSAWPLPRQLPRLPQLLSSETVNLRIAAGETIALLFELARDLEVRGGLGPADPTSPSQARCRGCPRKQGSLGSLYMETAPI